MSARRVLLFGATLGIIGLGVACGGSSRSSTPTAPTIPPFAATVSDLVKNHTNDTESPASLDSLNLAGADVEDLHQFDALLGIK